MIETMIAEMESSFSEGVFTESTSFRFILEGTAVTLIIDGESCKVERDSALTTVDCYCKTSADMFRKIWYDGYRPGIMDFLGGAIKCDNPLLLPQFLRAFGR